MVYCYDCGSDNIIEKGDDIMTKNLICKNCGSDRIYDDNDEDLEAKIMESLDEEDRRNFLQLIGIIVG